MPELKLTKTAVSELPYPANGQVIYNDSLLRGFGVRVGAKSKTYVVEGRVRNRTVRSTIGRADVLSTDVARKQAMLLLSQMAMGVNPNKAKRIEASKTITVKEAFDSYLDNKTHAKATVVAYQRTLRLHIADWRNKPLMELTKQMVLHRHRDVTKKHGAYQANAVMRHLRSVYNFTTAMLDDVPQNPVSVLTLARQWNKERRRHTVIPIHKLKCWYGAVMQMEDYARDFLLICLFTGMRRREVTTLKWEYIDLDGKTLHIPKTKNGDPLDLPLADFIIELLRERRSKTNSEWVFPGTGEYGHMVEHKKFLRRMESLWDGKFTFHDLRRTFITIAESLDIPSYALKRLLNHRTDNDVTGGYIVINSERLRDPVERVAQRILELVSEQAKETGIKRPLGFTRA